MGNKCGHCDKSKPESVICRYLESKCIDYIYEYSFDDCKHIDKLEFDFYLPKTNEIVEIDGVQHKTIVDGWGGEEGYLDRVHKDNMKNTYCTLNNIKLTRIEYDHKNKDDYNKLIHNFINEYNNTIWHLPKLRFNTESQHSLG
jgi:hypothetical protein